MRLRAPGEVWALFDLAAALVPGREGDGVSDGECLECLVDHFLSTWCAPELHPTQDEDLYRIAERDGWRCAAPGCTCRRGLAVHHIRYRSQGGGEEDENRILLCVAHHLDGVHAGRLRVTGEAPDRLVWELGLREGQALWRVRGRRIQERASDANTRASVDARGVSVTGDVGNATQKNATLMRFRTVGRNSE